MSTQGRGPRRQLAEVDPERLLVGHGPPLLEVAGPALGDGAGRHPPPGPGGLLGVLTSPVRG